MHPDHDAPDYHTSREETRRCFMTLDRILALNAIEVARARALTAAPPAAVPADRPADTAGGSPRPTSETPGPAI